jgi:hypothetical protein
MLLSNEQTKRNSWEYFLLRAAREISLSEAQYQKINDRYSQLEKILSASDNPLLAEAHIFVQGSMRLKTTIKPIPGAPADLDTIDADAIIWLPHAQGASAKEVLEAIEQRFREGSRVQEEVKQLRRGIRIVYADENPGFHIDVTPHVRSTEMAKPTARVSWRFRIGSQGGKQAALSLTRIGYRLPLPRKSLWKAW